MQSNCFSLEIQNIYCIFCLQSYMAIEIFDSSISFFLLWRMLDYS